MLFLLKGPYPLLRQFGAGLFGAVCAFSEEAFAFAILCGQGTSCFMLAVCVRLLCMHACSVCMLAVYAFLELCVHACFVYRLAAHTNLLCMHGYCVCTNAMYACLKLCTHA